MVAQWLRAAAKRAISSLGADEASLEEELLPMFASMRLFSI
jgi:hypothetical protein